MTAPLQYFFIVFLIIFQFIPTHSNSSTDCILGGIHGFISNDENNFTVSSLPNTPPILYLKTHKTGSGTVANILYRMGDVRQYVFMTNKPEAREPHLIGFPHAFPGEIRWYSKHSVDIINGHAVYNKEKMEYYMKPHPFRFTTLREPFTQQMSMYNYFYREHLTWDEYIDRESTVGIFHTEHRKEIYLAHSMNSQSFDLGWYQQMNNSFAYDHDRERIDAFIASIDRDFDLVICMEDMDRGLVLLSHMLGVSVNEMVNVAVAHHGEHDQYVYPSPEEYRTVIEELNPVDVALYNHFCPEKFDSLWRRTEAALHSDGVRRNKNIMTGNNVTNLFDRLIELQKMNNHILRACSCDGPHYCPPSMFIDEKYFSRYMAEKYEHRVSQTEMVCEHLHWAKKAIKSTKQIESALPICDH